MHAVASCPSCKKQLRVQEFLAGKQASCPSCDTVLDIPENLFATESPKHVPLPPPVIRVDGTTSLAANVLVASAHEQESIPQTDQRGFLSIQPLRFIGGIAFLFAAFIIRNESRTGAIWRSDWRLEELNMALYVSAGIGLLLIITSFMTFGGRYTSAHRKSPISVHRKSLIERIARKAGHSLGKLLHGVATRR